MFSQQNWPVQKKGLVLVLVPQAISLVILSAMYAVLYNAEQSEQKQAQAKAVFKLANQCQTDESGAVTNMVAYTVWSKPSYLIRYDQCVQDLNKNFAELDSREIGNKQALARLRHLKLLADQLVRILNGARVLAESGHDDAYSYMSLARMRTLLESLVRQYDSETEQLVDAPELRVGQTDDQQWRMRVQQFVIFAVATNLALSVLIALVFSRSITSRLKVLVENTFRLSSDQSLLQPLSGTDEIARLDTVFHHMQRALVSARQKERAVVDNAVDVICSIDKDQMFTAVNPAAKATWGYEPAELIGKSIQDILLPDSINSTIATMRKAMGEGVEVSFENSIKHSQGAIVCLLWSVRWSQTEEMFSCVVHDVTASKEVERMKQDFINMVSHDLRTPLSSIQCGLALVGSGAYGQLCEEGTEMVKTVENEVERLTALVNELLDLEKLKSGKMNLDYTIMDANEMLKRARESVQSLAENKKVDIKIESAPSQEPVLADLKRMIQLTVNLLSNAIKFSPAGGTIEITAGTDNDGLHVEVIDQGPGIDEQHRQTIFDQFYQVPASSGKQHLGTGLGLSICKAIVDAHGGEIGVKPGPQGGSKFWFAIPCSPVQQEDSVVAD